MTTATKILTGVPHHYQSEYDYACGPMAIRMVADYFYGLHENREMTTTEWLQVLDITMNNNIWRKTGTRKRDVLRALKKLSFKTTLINGNNFDSKFTSICKSIYRERPVIIYCVIKREGKRYKHFAVVVGVDDNAVYVRDPYPGKRRMKRPKRIGNRIFRCARPKRGQLVWGPVQWAIEVTK